MRATVNMADITFDEWRAAYRDLSDDDQLTYNIILAARYPDQDHAQIEPCRRFFNTLAPPYTVIELGGWTGRLAGHMLQRFPGIRSWRNLETYPLARFGQVPRTPRYRAVDPGRFYWWRDGRMWECDVLVACHFLEHFLADDVDDIIRCFPEARHLYLEVPLPEDGQPADWAGYSGTHILELGWDGLTDLLDVHGWRPSVVQGDCRWFRRP